MPIPAWAVGFFENIASTLPSIAVPGGGLLLLVDCASSRGVASANSTTAVNNDDTDERLDGTDDYG